MPQTLKNIKLTKGVWVDLYAEAGIAVGTQLTVENLTQYPIKLYSGATVPFGAEKDSDSGYFIRAIGYEKKSNDTGEDGLWGYSDILDGLVNVTTSVSSGIVSNLPITEDSNTKTYNTDAWFRNKSVIDKSLFSGMFTYNVPVSTWYEMIDDVEQTSLVSATSVNGKLVLASGALNEKRQLRSFRNPRYEPNRGHLYSNSAFLPDKNALAERTFGIFTSESGVGYRLRAGVLYAVLRTTLLGITSDIEDVITIPAGVDLDKGNVFDIQFEWRGVGDFFFYINLKIVHVIENLGNINELSMFNPAIPCAFECINQGDAVEMRVGCVDVTTEGGEGEGLTYGSVGTSTQTGSIAIANFNAPVLVTRNKSKFDSLINTRDVLSLLATGYADQRCVLRVWATRDETAITLNDQAWSDFRDGHIEFIEYDNPNVATPITFDTAKAELIFGSRVDQDQSYSTSALFQGRTDIYQTPGDIFIFTMHRENGGSANAGITFEFAEAI